MPFVLPETDYKTGMVDTNGRAVKCCLNPIYGKTVWLTHRVCCKTCKGWLSNEQTRQSIVNMPDLYEAQAQRRTARFLDGNRRRLQAVAEPENRERNCGGCHVPMKYLDECGLPKSLINGGRDEARKQYPRTLASPNIFLDNCKGIAQLSRAKFICYRCYRTEKHRRGQGRDRPPQKKLTKELNVANAAGSMEMCTAALEEV